MISSCTRPHRGGASRWAAAAGALIAAALSAQAFHLLARAHSAGLRWLLGLVAVGVGWKAITLALLGPTRLPVQSSEPSDPRTVSATPID